MDQAFQWPQIISEVNAGGHLDYDRAYWVMDQVMRGELGESRLAAFLTSMHIKGATVEEVHGLADAMADHAVSVDLPSRALDIVGTGGDGHKTVNISTMSSIVLAAAGVPLVKHGNRASTSQSGSADVLEALGVNFNVSAQRQREIFDALGIAFLFANHVHPSMRFAAPVRRALGFPTAFNVLGPLTNPAKVEASVIGCSNERNAPLMAGVFAQRGSCAMVFRGQNTALDELSTVDVNQVWNAVDGQIEELHFDPTELYDMAPAAIADLRGGDAEENALVAREVLSGGGTRAVRDAVALNVAAGLTTWSRLEGTTSNFVDTFGDHVTRALTLLDEGAGMNLLDRWIDMTRS
ncbi:anthranilate phosphoribosyltransferase [Schaalia vaccimaxillae]|uniref:anthranilate phosphoribosyltransferase n=1 Tax=Schaalia vaccimaxillae TaxID=183916 RepID=UPI0003B6BA05|nr:anthranilate phosphoribosyltransferase [Schaalia vaccimaxillae]